MGQREPSATNRTPGLPARCGSQRSHSDRDEPRPVEILGVRSATVVSGRRDERIASVAELQRGHITWGQLRAVGLTECAIERRIAAGALIRVHPRVYAVRPVLEAPFGREVAALLACGPNAFLSHGSAASLWKLCVPVGGPVELTISNRRHRHTPGIRAHRARHLLPRDVTVEQGLPVTSPARMLLDRAATMTAREFERELDEALVVLRIVRPGELSDIVARTRGHPGWGTLRRLLGRRLHETITQSEAERLFLALVREAGLPEPETQVKLAGYRVDFLWRRERVVFEIDGYRFHSSRSSFDRDRRKDLALKQAGYDPNRVSRDQVKYEPLAVISYLSGALARAAVAIP